MPPTVQLRSSPGGRTKCSGHSTENTAPRRSPDEHRQLGRIVQPSAYGPPDRDRERARPGTVRFDRVRPFGQPAEQARCRPRSRGRQAQDDPARGRRESRLRRQRHRNPASRSLLYGLHHRCALCAVRRPFAFSHHRIGQSPRFSYLEVPERDSRESQPRRDEPSRIRPAAGAPRVYPACEGGERAPGRRFGNRHPAPDQARPLRTVSGSKKRGRFPPLQGSLPLTKVCSGGKYSYLLADLMSMRFVDSFRPRAFGAAILTFVMLLGSQAAERAGKASADRATGKAARPKHLPLDRLGYVALKTPANSQYLRDRIIVKLGPAQTPVNGGARTALSFGIPGLDQVAQRYSVAGIARVFPEAKAPVREGEVDLTRFYVMKYSSPVDPFSAAKELSDLPEVDYAEPWFIYPTNGAQAFTPNDSLYLLQWAMGVIRADSAWSVSQGDTSVVVGIVDTGVQWDHPDLAANIWINPDISSEIGMVPLNAGIHDADDHRGIPLAYAPGAVGADYSHGPLQQIERVVGGECLSAVRGVDEPWFGVIDFGEIRKFFRGAEGIDRGGVFHDVEPGQVDFAFTHGRLRLREYARNARHGIALGDLVKARDTKGERRPRSAVDRRLSGAEFDDDPVAEVLAVCRRFQGDIPEPVEREMLWPGGFPRRAVGGCLACAFCGLGTKQHHEGQDSRTEGPGPEGVDETHAHEVC